VDSTEKKIIQHNCNASYLEYYVSAVVSVHISNTVQKLKANNIWTFLTRENNKGNHFQLFSQALHLEPIKLGKRLYVSML
jgi:hypothetical protein